MDHYLKEELYERVRAQPEIFEFVESGSFDGLWYWDLENPERQWLSPRFNEVLGYDEQGELDRRDSWRSIIHPEDLAAVLHKLEAFVGDPGRGFDEVVRFVHKQGSVVWLRCRALALRNDEGRCVRLLCSHRDVTAVIEAHEARSSLAANREQEQRFRLLTESLPQLVWTCSPDGECDYLSTKWVEYTGVPSESQLGSGWLAQVHPEDRTRLIDQWKRAVSSGNEFRAEFRIRRHDGEYRWFDTRGVPVKDPRGRITAWVGSNTDVTEQRLIDERLRRSQERMETVIAHMSEGLLIADLDGRSLHWNPACVAMHGFTSQEQWLKKLGEFRDAFVLSTLQGRALPFEEWPLNRILRGETLGDVELRVSRTDKSWERVFAYKGSLVREPSGEALAFLTITDVTERDLALRSLRDSEHRLRVANEVAKIGTYETDLRTGRVKFSHALSEIFGMPPAIELPLADAFRLVHPDDVKEVERLFSASMSSPADPTASLEIRVIHPTGDMRWVAWSSRVLFEDTAEGFVPVRAIGASFDITDRRLAERRVSTHNAVSRVLADALTLDEAAPEIMRAICESECWDFAAIWQVDEETDRLRCSHVWHRPELALDSLERHTRELSFPRGSGLPGRAWRLRKPLLIKDLATDPSYSRSEQALAHGLKSALAFPILLRGKVTGVIDFVGRMVHGPGEKVLDTFAPIGPQLGIFFERKRAEAERRDLQKQLLQSQKMEALGQLSGGIAHDFNNILASILGNAELALQLAAPVDPLRDNLKAIEEASRRAKQLVLQILTFARRQPQERRVVALAPLLEQGAGLLRATLPASVELTLSTAADVPEILADPTQIQQVFLNLVTNAWHALPVQCGRIEVVLSSTVLDAEQARALSGVRPGRFARLVVRDSGHGMEPALLDRIFEPFFTTKGPGQGTGLGLSVVLGIVQNHDGAVHVSSEPGRGSTFSVYLPASPHAAPPERLEPAPAENGGGQRILYLDDETPLVSVARRTLSRLGYEVVGFTNPAQAIEAFTADPQSFALVATDMNMPQISGLQVAERLKQVRPDVPIVLLSGHITDDLKQAAIRAGVSHFLYKPWTLKELGDVVRRALEGAVSARP